MKRLISLILTCALMLSLLSGCGVKPAEEKVAAGVAPTAAAAAEKAETAKETSVPESEAAEESAAEQGQEDGATEMDDENAEEPGAPTEYKTITPEFSGLSDPELLTYLEDDIYSELVADLDSDEYFVENVSAVYVSKEYLEELAYNSKTNIFFGYSLEDLDAQFQGTRYAFTLGPDGDTIVRPFEAYDDTYDTILRNVAIGSGVILVCVTVSVVSGGVGAPAVSMIFAASAKTGTVMALSGGAFGGITAGIIKILESEDRDEILKYTAVGGLTGAFIRVLESEDRDEILKAMALGSSEGFMWGAISGSLRGGISEASALAGATLNGLSMNEAAIIQKESKLPLSFIKNFHSVEEYEIYKTAGLNAERIGGVLTYSRPIDMDSVITDRYGHTMTNADRIRTLNNSPVDANGIPYELHHIGQQPDSPLAILTKAEHMQDGHNPILHFRAESSVEHGTNWSKQVIDFWMNYLENVG
ncbi:MAG: HNH/ENDO VII family nuclease [Eubacteriales bacterium]|nr:HNH/ENDO VII family nuclease [Eubacteriales bacterium]